MIQHSHQTAPTQLVDVNGIRFAYRRFGKSGGLPLVFTMHFTGTMGQWDPAVTDDFAEDRGVILFDNAGISSSSVARSRPPSGRCRQRRGLHQGARSDAGRCAGLLNRRLHRAALAIAEPELVRGVVLVGAGPRGGEGMATLTPEAQEIFGATL